MWSVYVIQLRSLGFDRELYQLAFQVGNVCFIKAIIARHKEHDP